MKLDTSGMIAPNLDAEDFTIVNNYLVDFWGAIMGDSAVSTFLHLKRYARGNKEICYIDIDMIALKMGKSKNQVNEYLSTLEEHGFIAVFLQKDAEDNNRDLSPLFKIRRHVPLITKEMYDNLHPRLQTLHDDFLAEFDGIELSSKPSNANEVIMEIANNAKVVNDTEAKEKIEKVPMENRPVEYDLNPLSAEEAAANKLIHDMIEEKVSRPSFETWIKNAVFIKRDDLTIKVIAPNSFARDWIASHYSNLIKEISAEYLSFNSVDGTVEVVTLSDYIKN